MHSLVAVVVCARSTPPSSIEILFVVVSERVSLWCVLLQNDRISLVRASGRIATHTVVVARPFGRLPISNERSERTFVLILRLLLELSRRQVRAVLTAIQIAMRNRRRQGEFRKKGVSLLTGLSHCHDSGSPRTPSR